MRLVQVFKYTQRQDASGQRVWDKSDDGTAMFHQFGVNFEDCEFGTGNFSTAIVERDNGTVENVAADMIKFIDMAENN